MIKIYQGETAVIEISVVERTGAASNLAGATGIFAFEGADGVVKKECVITNNVVSAELSPQETAGLLGEYPFEIKIQDVSMNVDSIIKDKFIVIDSILPVYTME